MISVVVPVYNVEEYLVKCVESLIHQDFDEEYEIVLVDDGATDRSGVMCDELAEKYPNVHTFHKKNGGLSSARNYGMKCAQGDLITFVDSDDFVSDKYLRHMYDLLTKFDADMAITCNNIRNSEDEVFEDHRFEDYCVSAKRAFYEVYYGDYVNWTAWGKLYKKSVIPEDVFPDGYYEDTACMYKILERCRKVALGDYCNDYYYIKREGSITFSAFNKKHLRVFEVCDELLEYIDRKYPDLDFIGVKVCQNMIELVLNRVGLESGEFNTFFYRYRNLFRKNLVRFMKKRGYKIENKVYMMVLCTTPGIYKAFLACVNARKKLITKKRGESV